MQIVYVYIFWFKWYICLLYTHQCIAKNTWRTEQWNTNQRIAFSVSPQCDFPNS